MTKQLKLLCALLTGLTLAASIHANTLTKNGDMSQGEATPSGWKLSKGVDPSSVKFTRDTTVYKSAPASLYLESLSGGKDVSVYQILRPKADKVKISGDIRAEGSFSKVVVAAQIFDANWKQLKWENVAVIDAPGDWRKFSRTLSLPSGAAHINLQLRITGTAKVWMDNVEAVEIVPTPAPAPAQTTPANDSAAAPVSKPKSGNYSNRQPIRRVDTTEPVVALTFDDGPMNGIYLKMLDVFKQEGIHVTFFEIGDKVRTYPAGTQRAYAEGHEIGSHSVSHGNITKLKTMDEVRAEIVGNQAIIKETIGVEPKVFRAPMIKHDDRMWVVLDELGLPSIGARRSTSDWNHDTSVEAIIDNATLNTQPGDIVLMHSWSPKTLQALPEIIQRLRAKGFRFVTVSELLAMQQNNA